MNEIRVRFAPSPTGYLHIGSARTALFNWLFAMANKGKFFLRIEDTDLERSDVKYLEEILESLKWLGIDWDDEPVYQSKRFNLYNEKADVLIKEGKAYYEDTEKGRAIRLTVPKSEAIVFYDLIRDKIEIDSSTIGDLVLIKSDGTPTYNFACVIDDSDMGITHIIRGEDHISNTPKQLVVYRALDIRPPKFAHIPLILGEDRSRMSKRHGATSIAEYRQRGYLPEALVNFLALMGWSPKNDQEKLKLEKIVSLFSLKSITKTGAVFNIKKLDWLNAEYIKEKSLTELTDFVAEHLIDRKIIDKNYNRKWLEDMIRCYQTRFCNIDDLIEKSEFLFKDDLDYDTEAVEKYLTKDAKNNLSKLKEKITLLGELDVEGSEKVIRELSEELNINAGELIHPARVALTGRASAPGIFEIMALIGKDRVVERLEKIL